jgi:hypothetical protein
MSGTLPNIYLTFIFRCLIDFFNNSLSHLPYFFLFISYNFKFLKFIYLFSHNHVVLLIFDYSINHIIAEFSWVRPTFTFITV